MFSSAPAAGGLLLSTLAGRGFDRRPTRRYALVAAMVIALGFVLLTETTSFVALIAIAVTLLAALQVVFPQLFALARVLLGNSEAGRRSAPLLRSGWSLAWAVGPLAGAALLADAGFAGLLGTATAVLVVTTVSTAAVPSPRPPDRTGPDHAREPSPALDASPRRGLLVLLTAGVALFFLAMFAGSVALPLYVTRGLHRPDTDIGLLYSACAAVEVLVALAMARRPDRVPQRILITAGMGALAAYFFLTVAAQNLVLLLIGQLARGTAIALVGAAGIRYFQELLAPAAGWATTLFTNASTAGSLLAGVLAGVSVQNWGYRPTLALCGATALLGAVAFTSAAVAARPQRR